MSPEVISVAVSFLVMLNPFALFLYLRPVMEDLSTRMFAEVLVRATVISFFIFAIFALSGNFLFAEVLQIHFESFRILGGIIIFSFAFIFVVGGKSIYLSMKESLDKLASEIALPFMVGAGTISLSIVMGEQFSSLVTLTSIAVILAITYGIIMGLLFLRAQFPQRLRIGFDKLMEIFLRINGFFMGAIGVDLVITGINALYF